MKRQVQIHKELRLAAPGLILLFHILDILAYSCLDPFQVIFHRDNSLNELFLRQCWFRKFAADIVYKLSYFLYFINMNLIGFIDRI